MEKNNTDSACVAAERPTMTFRVNKCLVKATFQPSGKGVDLEHVRRLLVSSFIQKYDAEKPGI